MYQTQESTHSFEQTMAALNPEGVMDDWRQRTLRILRAQERVMQGMAAAARLELRFGQECLASRLGLYSGGWGEPGQASQHWADEMEKFISVVHEMNEEMKTCFSEAGKLLNGNGAAVSENKLESAAKRTQIAVENIGENVGEKVDEEAGEPAEPAE